MKKSLKKIPHVVVLVIIGIVALYLYEVRPVGGVKERIFVINRGESLPSIASRLEREKIIRSRHLFLFTAWRLHLNEKIQAGTFRIKTNSSLAEIAKQLTIGKIDEWVTLLEGWRKEEMAEELAKKVNVDKEQFFILTKDKEGMLFPDSYLFPIGMSPDKIVATLENNFEKKYSLVASTVEQRKLNKEETLILASLIEREAKNNIDKPIVAGILIKRGQNNWLLQVDATVQYAVASKNCRLKTGGCDWWPKKLTKTDLEINSPYNTYRFKGLPPAPICNPSLKSLEAVANYQESSYWFYMSDNQGKIHFAETLEEHQENIQKYLGS